MSFEIFIKQKLYAEISYLFRKQQKEVGALLECYNEDEKFIVEKMFITKQTVSSAEVDFDEDAIDKLLLNCVEDGTVISGWLHSHNSMKAFWSGTDEQTITKLNDYIGNWLLSIVGNNKMELVGRIDYVSETPFGATVTTVDNVPIFTLPEISSEDMEAIDTIVAQNVTTRPVNHQYKTQWNNGKYRGRQAKAVAKTAVTPNIDIFDDMPDKDLAEMYGYTLREWQDMLHEYDSENENVSSKSVNNMTEDEWSKTQVTT